MFHLIKKSGSSKSEPKDVQREKNLNAIPVYQTMWNSIDSLVTMDSYSADEIKDVEMLLQQQFPSYRWSLIQRSIAYRTADGVLHATYGFKGTLDPIINSKRKESIKCHVKPVPVIIIRGSAKAR